MLSNGIVNEIELRQLRYFAAVAEKLSFGKAAKALHVSQPPLSRQIRDLERTIGAVLLNRSPQGVSLTQAGSIFYNQTQRILLNVQSAAELARRAENGQAGTLTIGCSHYLDIVLRRSLCSECAPSGSGLRLNYETLPSVDQVHLLRHCGLDAGVVRLPLPEADQLSIDVLGREQIVAMVATRHPFATRASVSLKDLGYEPVLVMQRHSTTRRQDQILRVCDDAGLVTEAIESREPVVDLLDSVRLQARVALVPSSMSYAQLGGVTFVPLEEKHATIGIGLLYRREDPSPALSRFLTSAHRLPSDLLCRDMDHMEVNREIQ